MGLLLMRNSFYKKKIFLFITLLTLSGCVSSGGYKNPWKVNERSASASQAPSTLSSGRMRLRMLQAIMFIVRIIKAHWFWAKTDFL